MDDAKTALFLSEETLQKLTGRKAEVEPGTYRTVITPGYKENIWEHVDGLYRAANPDTGREKELVFAGTVEDGNLPLMSDPYTYVIDNGDYEELTEGISRTWTEQLIMFDVDDLEGSYPFAKALYAMYVERASEETFVMTLYDRWEEERAREAGQEYGYSDRLDVTPDDTGSLTNGNMCRISGSCTARISSRASVCMSCSACISSLSLSPRQRS